MNIQSLTNCRVCGAVFMHINGPALCEKCAEELDRIYYLAREELRNSSGKEKLGSLELADRLQVDPIYIQIIMEEGLFESEEYSPDDSRENLLGQFQSELQRMEQSKKNEKNCKRGMYLEQRRKSDRD